MERRYFLRQETDIEVSVYEGASWLGRATVGNLSMEGLKLQWLAPDMRRHSILELELLPADSRLPPRRVPIMVLWQDALAAGGVFAEAGCFKRLQDASGMPASVQGTAANTATYSLRLLGPAASRA